jgi:putative addiction module component (TIGR02574 family)
LPYRQTSGRLKAMTNALRKELFQLSTAERLELVEELWDSIAAERESEPFPLNNAQRQELDRRVRELDEHPERARRWEEVRTRLWARKRA